MSLNTKRLKKLCSFHSVAGDTQDFIDYLSRYFKKKNVPTHITDYGILLVGNYKNPKLMISAHVDEVGFQIAKETVNGTFQVIPSGHVSASLLNNSHVYVATESGHVEGMFFPSLELGNNNPENLTQIFLDTLNNKNISIGDYGSYQRVFKSNSSKIIATGLDNKISVEMLISLIEEKPELLEKVVFAFVTEEELSYGCMVGLSNLIKPDFALVVDMFPSHYQSTETVHVKPELKAGGGVLVGMSKYKLHSSIYMSLPKLKSKYQKIFADLPFAPEAEIIQKNGVTKACNVFIPMYGWHNAAYSLYKQDYAHTKNLVLELTGLLLNS